MVVLLVVCLNVSNKLKKDNYKYEVHTGLHSFKAREVLQSEGVLRQCDVVMQMVILIIN